jgi:tight adherence protein C
MSDSTGVALTLLAIAPLLVLGAWYIAIESFAGPSHEILESVPKNVNGSAIQKDLNSQRVREKFQKKRTGDYPRKRNFDELFVLWASITLLVAIFTSLYWERVRGVLALGGLVTLLIMIYEKRRMKSRSVQEEIQVELELPQVIQTICLLISAGISPIKALQIISQGSNSLIARDFREVILDVSEGHSAYGALDKLLVSSTSSGMRRFVTSLIVAIERGSPLVPVLVSLVRDSQSEWRTRLLKNAGKAEIGLMIPVVFLLLPLSVLFALFPSLLELQSI